LRIAVGAAAAERVAGALERPRPRWSSARRRAAVLVCVFFATATAHIRAQANSLCQPVLGW